ncbi:methylenetetrahydrofolate reductase [Paenibacillus sp. TRM 82003]|uniref:methylenetetrahydrofolate reductase n=1 Tax=Kineococcus sp. TRM81007 TaxID=2925831 RepID=UPI001F577951|nr:methylenetetrahydrofolate reductase [Kineococcus sp. TRM81007]MCI2240694.1 methylenetetrahydrofolate reductase [Kineococcus sp. TRM81007]MCI3925384.1 methylenetetrahydrofolate reductase [Paenibacillus sp. TRM 82003]
MADRAQEPLRRALESAGYEVLPFPGTAEAVLAHVPRTVPLTVTASPSRGTAATLELTERLSAEGYRVAPHLSARMLRDEAELREVVDRLRVAGTTSVFVVGGDAQDAGEFPDALSLLRALHRVGHPFADVGVAGYPEGHASLATADLERSLVRKAPLAHHVVTQVCFDPAVIAAWAREVAALGVHLPVRVGVPGAVSREKLLRITAGIGVGESVRFLRKQPGLLRRFFARHGYDPGPVLAGLAGEFGAAAHHLAGLHVFTFNDVAGTEAWRQDALRRLDRRR